MQHDDRLALPFIYIMHGNAKRLMIVRRKRKSAVERFVLDAEHGVFLCESG